MWLETVAVNDDGIVDASRQSASQAWASIYYLREVRSYLNWTSTLLLRRSGGGWNNEENSLVCSIWCCCVVVV